MKKNLTHLILYRDRAKTRQWLMRLTVLKMILLMSLLTTYGRVNSQMIISNLKLENVELSEALERVEELSDYDFIFSYDDVQGYQVSVDLESATLEECLNVVFKELPFEYNAEGDVVIVSYKMPEPKIIEQQEKKSITGQVTDTNGDPIPGVSIVVKGTVNGVATDIDGHYSIEVSAGANVLLFSFVGMKTQEMTIDGKATFDVVMTEDALGLEEVIVVGYGTTTKRKLVSAISTITTEAIADAPYTSVVSGLAGRTPGLFVQESGGEPGSLPKISIRGGGDPIYVIDGIQSSVNEFAMLPPDDIEAISTLKDASAAAVYGFNSADGVILVTTKRGDSGKVTLTYSGNFSFQEPTLVPEYSNAYDNALMRNAASFNDGLPQAVSDEDLNIIKNNLDPLMYPNSNPFRVVGKDLSAQQRHTVGLNGTMGQTRVYMSLDYFKQDGIYRANDGGLKRYSFRSSISQSFDKIGLTVTGNVSLQRSKKISPPNGSIWSHVRNVGGFYRFHNPDGNYHEGENPLAESDEAAGYHDFETNRVNGRLEFAWNVPGVDGLSFKALGNYRSKSIFEKTWNANRRGRAQTYNWANLPEDLGKGSLSQKASKDYVYDIEAHAIYTRTFAEKHTVELTGVYSQSESRLDEFETSRRDFISPEVDQLFAGSSEGINNSGKAFEGASTGFVGRLKYDFDAKYILEGSFRYDGSDYFPKGKRYGFFPALSAGWNIDREEFVQPILEKLSLTSLKLRASWGILGSLKGGTKFAYISSYNLKPNQYFVDGKYEAGFREGNLVLNDVTWFERETTNLGVDFGLMGGKLSGSFDWFYYRTTGFLGSPSDTYTTPLGKSLPEINTDAAHRRGGVELNMQYHTQVGEVKINIGGNISYYDQLWEKRFDEDSTALLNPYTRETHEKDYATTGYTSLGYYQNTDDIINAPHRLGATETKPGDLQYADLNGDGLIDGEDFSRIGKGSFPHIYYGFNIGANYKGFALEALFQGTSNRQVYLGEMWQQAALRQLYTVQEDSWTTENTNSLFPRISMNDDVNGRNNDRPSDFWLKDAWYIRMKSLALSYDFKSTLLRNVTSVGSLKLLLSATNLFTISPLNKYYMDPESSGSENYGYPVQRTYNIGVRVSF